MVQANVAEMFSPAPSVHTATASARKATPVVCGRKRMCDAVSRTMRIHTQTCAVGKGHGLTFEYSEFSAMRTATLPLVNATGLQS